MSFNVSTPPESILSNQLVRRKALSIPAQPTHTEHPSCTEPPYQPVNFLATVTSISQDFFFTFQLDCPLLAFRQSRSLPVPASSAKDISESIIEIVSVHRARQTSGASETGFDPLAIPERLIITPSSEGTKIVSHLTCPDSMLHSLTLRL